MCAYHDKTTLGFKVFIGEQDNSGTPGVARDCRFDFACISRGRIFCHGSVSGAGVADVEANYG